MYRDALAIFNRFLGHQTQGDDKTIQLDRHLDKMGYLVTIDIVMQRVVATMVTDAITVQLASRCLDWQFAEIAKISGFIGVCFIGKRWHTWKRQYRVDSGDNVVT